LLEIDLDNEDISRLLTLTPDLAEDNTTLADLVADLEDLLLEAGITEFLSIYPLNNRLVLETKEAGSAQTIRVTSSRNTTKTLQFVSSDGVARSLLLETNSSPGAFGFANSQNAQGSDWSFRIVEIPTVGYQPTTGLVQEDDRAIGTRVLLVDNQGQITTGVNFGNAPVVSLALPATVTVNEGEALFIPSVIIDPLDRSSNPYTFRWIVQSNNPIPSDAIGAANSLVILESTDPNFRGVLSDSGSYIARLTVTDTERNVTTTPYTVTVNVLNVAPTLDSIELSSATGDRYRENEKITLKVAYSDPGLLDFHTATVNWGDRSESEFLELVTDQGSGTFSTSYTYAEGGTYVITVTVTDKDGDTRSQSFPITVLDIVINTAPSELQFNLDKTDYNAGETLNLSGAWVQDLNGSSDLSRVDLWVLNPDGQWIDLSDVTSFSPWAGGAEWGGFLYSLDLTNYVAGTYTLWAQAFDRAGAASNVVEKTFRV
jgi:hypothetical protein